MSDSWNSDEYVDRYNEVYRFREAEVSAHLQPLALGVSDSFVDFGCGEGASLFFASRTVRLAVGVDSSPHQVARARRLLAGLKNVEIIESPFLECNLSEYIFTKASARKSLHHLTDDEKQAFFRKISRVLAGGALFLLEDGILDFDRSRIPEKMPQIVAEASEYYGSRWETIRSDVLDTIENEFPTGIDAWTAAMREGGLEVVERKRKTCFYGSILARRVPS